MSHMGRSRLASRPFPGEGPGNVPRIPQEFPRIPRWISREFPYRVSRRFPGIGRPGDCLATLWHMGRCRPASRPFPGKVPGISREFSRNFPRFPGGSPGNFPRVSRRFPAIARPKVTASQPCRTWGALGRPRGPFLTLSRSCVSGGSERSELRAERGEGVPGTCRGRAGDVLFPFPSLFEFPCLSPSVFVKIELIKERERERERERARESERENHTQRPSDR